MNDVTEGVITFQNYVDRANSPIIVLDFYRAYRSSFTYDILE
jgi:hypothetical protein